MREPGYTVHVRYNGRLPLAEKEPGYTGQVGYDSRAPPGRELAGVYRA